MNIYSIAGTQNTASFPHGENSTCPKCPSFCKSVSRHFPNGEYKLGVPWAPTLSRKQRDALGAVCTDDPKAEFVPFTQWLAYVPGEHKTLDMGLRVEPDVSSCCGPRTCCSTDPKGMTFSIMSVQVDAAALAEDPNCNIEDHFKAAPAVVGAASALAADEYSFRCLAFAREVPTGCVLLVGIRIDTPPESGNICCVKSRITPVISVRSYAAPTQVG